MKKTCLILLIFISLLISCSGNAPIEYDGELSDKFEISVNFSRNKEEFPVKVQVKNVELDKTVDIGNINSESFEDRIKIYLSKDYTYIFTATTSKGRIDTKESSFRSINFSFY